jgi:hypothetical protein
MCSAFPSRHLACFCSRSLSQLYGSEVDLHPFVNGVEAILELTELPYWLMQLTFMDFL